MNRLSRKARREVVDHKHYAALPSADEILAHVDAILTRVDVKLKNYEADPVHDEELLGKARAALTRMHAREASEQIREKQ